MIELLIFGGILVWGISTFARNKEHSQQSKAVQKKIDELTQDLHLAQGQIKTLNRQMSELTKAGDVATEMKVESGMTPDPTQTFHRPISDMQNVQQAPPEVSPKVSSEYLGNSDANRFGSLGQSDDRIVDKTKTLHHVASAVPPTKPLEMPKVAKTISQATPPVASVNNATTSDADDDIETRAAQRGVSNLELKLGLWGGVVLGAITIAIAGFFLVRHFANNGFFSPTIRMILAAFAGFALLAVGQFVGKLDKFIRSGLVAAAVVVLYGTTYASTNLHELISDQTGFICMVCLTIATIFLSIKHGKLVAILGLIGGMLTPALTGSDELSAKQVLGYVLLLQVGMTILHHRMNWTGLKFITLACSFLWCIVQMLFDDGQTDAMFFNTFILMTIATLGVSSLLALRKNNDSSLHTLLNILSMAGALLLGSVLVHQTGYDPKQWAFMGILSVGTLILGRLKEKQAYLPGLAAGCIALNVILAMQNTNGMPLHLNNVVIGFGILFGLGSYLCLWRSSIPKQWAAFCVAAALGYTVLYQVACEPASPWISLTVMTSVMALLSIPLWLKPQDENRDILAMFMGMMIFFATWAIHDGLQMQFKTLGFGAMMLLLAGLVRFLKLKQIDVGVFILGLLVGCRLLVNMHIKDYGLHESLWQSWIVYTYVFAAVMSYLSGKCLKNLGKFNALVAVFDVLAAVLIWAMSTLLVAHSYHHGQWDRLFNLDSLGINTYTTVVIVWLLLAMGMIFFPREKCNKPFLNVSYAAYLGAMMVSLFFGCLICNPLWNDFAVGSTPVWNGLLFYYGLPMLLILVVMAWGHWEKEVQLIRPVAAVVSLILAFVLLSLEVRQIYQGEFLNGGMPGLAEMYTYSAAWLGFAMMLFGLGLWQRNAPLRYAGMAVMAITIGKVFLLDTRHLEDIYRVMSFLGLGLCLFGVAIGYQLLVRKKRLPTS